MRRLRSFLENLLTWFSFLGKDRGWKLLVAVCLLLIGALIPSFVRNEFRKLNSYSSAQIEFDSYQQQIRLLQEENEALKEEEQRLWENRATLGEDILRESGLMAWAEELSALRMAAGFSPISGAGVRIVLNDATITNPEDVTQTSLIHEDDILYIVNLLNSCGVEGITINGERLTGISGIECNGPKIRINNTRHPVPFVIEAVCDPESTLLVLDMDSRIVKRRGDGVEISASASDELTLSAYMNARVLENYSAVRGAT